MMDYPNKIVCQEGRITNQTHSVRHPANDIYRIRIYKSIYGILFHLYRYLVCNSAYNVLVKKKGKVRPCTGTEALYRPYGP